MAKLYLVNINAMTASECSSLSLERQRKADSYRFEKDRRLCLAAGVALDRALKDRGLSEKDFLVSYGEFGKPYIKELPDFKFNLSHAGNLAVVAVSEKEIGCDIEMMGRYSEAIVRRCFSADEQSYVNNSKDKYAAFTRIWAAKESFLKALGIGLSAKLPDVSVHFEENGIRIEQKIDPRHWSTEERAIEEYILAVTEEA